MSSPLRHNFDHTRRKKDLLPSQEMWIIDNLKSEQKHIIMNYKPTHHHNNQGAFTQLPSELICDPPSAHNNHDHKQMAHVKRKKCCATDREKQGSEESESCAFQPNKDASKMSSSDKNNFREMGIYDMRRRHMLSTIRLTTSSQSQTMRDCSPLKHYWGDESLAKSSFNSGSLSNCDTSPIVIRRWEANHSDNVNSKFNFTEKISHSCSAMVEIVKRKMSYFNCTTEPEKKCNLSRGKGRNNLTKSNKNENVIISSTSLRRETYQASNVILARLLNFVLCSAFLIHSINYYYQPVMGEQPASNPNYVNFLTNYEAKSKHVKDFVSFPSSSSSWSFLRSNNNDPNVFDNGADHDHNDLRNQLDNLNPSISSAPSSMKPALRERRRTGRGTASSSLTAQEKLQNMLSQPLDQLDKNILLQTVWEAMTPEEVRRIFGHKKSSVTSSETVPNFDITKPQVLNESMHQRRKRHASFTINEDETENQLKDSGSFGKKLIQLEGLGRQFTMRIYPNQKLLDPYFVHLHRHENRSEILPHEIVRKQLNCFYHGEVEHGEGKKDAETGTAALSLCGGMKGFILPSSAKSAEQYHYVIHPLPDRITNLMGKTGSVDQIKSASSSRVNYDDNNMEGHSGHHIIFRRTGSFYPPEIAKLLRTTDQSERLMHDKNRVVGDNRENMHKMRKPNANEESEERMASDDNVEINSCMHHDTVGARGKHDHSHAINEELDDFGELGPKLEHRKMPIISGSYSAPALKNELNYNADYGSYKGEVNDLKLLSERSKERLTPSEMVSSTIASKLSDDDDDEKHFRARRRKRRAPNLDSDTIDPFTFKSNGPPADVNPNWGRFGGYRATGSGQREHYIADSSYDQGNHGEETRLSSHFTYNDGFKAPSRFTSTIDANGRVLSNQNIFWHTNSRHSQTAPDSMKSRSGRLVSGGGGPRSRYDEIITAPVTLEDSSVAGSDHMTWNRGILVFESSAIHENNYDDKNVPFVTKGAGGKRNSRKETTSVVSSTSSRSSSNSNVGNPGGSPSFDWFSGRIGNYERPTKSYSALKDSFTIGSRKGRRDDGAFGDKWKSSLDADAAWSDKSNEIGKQNKFNDLSQVKDRPPSHLTIETAVFIDKDLYKHMQQNFPEDTQGEVTAIVLAMINAVQLLYQDPSLGHRVDFVLKRLEVLETDPPTLIRPYDIDRFLTNFCKWQKTENPASDENPLHWDHALILTGLDLYVVHQSGKISNQVVGLAPVAGMCTRSSSCTVNEGKHFESVFVVAHEVAHNLGMRHDGPQAENNCDPTSHIMSPTLGSGKITWSPCSKKYLDMFLDTEQAKCLFDADKSEKWLDHNEDGRLPGERFDADRQCVLKYGRGSFHANQQPLEDVCRDLHCRREFFTWTSHPALDGTTCSATGDMWCRSGKCVQKNKKDWSYPLGSKDPSILANNSSKYPGFYGSSNHLPGSETAAYATQKALDGGWGKWSPFTDCSSACIYSDDGKLAAGSTGVRLAARRCDSPRPENGGRQCNGPDRRYKTCSGNSICGKSLTRTTLFQYANEVCTRAAQVDAELSGRGYMSSSSEPEKACSVWCETNDKSGPRSRGWSFPDGTVCTLKSSLKNSQTYCVAGKCQEFSCNPYSIFRLSDEDCISVNSNEIIQIHPFERNRDSTADDSWQSSDSRNSGTRINQRSNEVGWSDWDSQSECKLACLAPAKGLELVKRHCVLGDTVCTGLSLSVRLCKPDKSAVQKNGCVRSQTPFEYATKVCTKYARKVGGLSGIGMQLSPTKGDSDRPCRIGCQDAKIPYRFYMVNGDEGWFPAGTDCSRGERHKKAYCIAGKCVAFGEDDTPLYHTNTSLKESYLQLPRTKRQTAYKILEPLKMDPNLDESSLKELVYKFSHETGNYPSISVQNFARRRSDTVIDRDANRGFSSRQLIFNDPSNGGFPRSGAFERTDSNIPRTDYHGFKRQSNSFVNNTITDEMSGKYKPIEGSYYEWRKIVSDCSVVCGNGIQEVIVQCVSGNTVVSDAMCQERQRPGISGYQNCFNRACVENPSFPSTSPNVETGGRSQLWNWIQNILPKKDKASNTNIDYHSTYN